MNYEEKYVIDSSILEATANAIRGKLSSSDLITPSNFATNINNINLGSDIIKVVVDTETDILSFTMKNPKSYLLVFTCEKQEGMMQSQLISCIYNTSGSYHNWNRVKGTLLDNGELVNITNDMYAVGFEKSGNRYTIREDITTAVWFKGTYYIIPIDTI